MTNSSDLSLQAYQSEAIRRLVADLKSGPQISLSSWLVEQFILDQVTAYNASGYLSFFCNAFNFLGQASLGALTSWIVYGFYHSIDTIATFSVEQQFETENNTAYYFAWLPIVLSAIPSIIYVSQLLMNTWDQTKDITSDSETQNDDRDDDDRSLTGEKSKALYESTVKAILGEGLDDLFERDSVTENTKPKIFEIAGKLIQLYDTIIKPQPVYYQTLGSISVKVLERLEVIKELFAEFKSIYEAPKEELCALLTIAGRIEDRYGLPLGYLERMLYRNFNEVPDSKVACQIYKKRREVCEKQNNSAEQKNTEWLSERIDSLKILEDKFSQEARTASHQEEAPKYRRLQSFYHLRDDKDNESEQAEHVFDHFKATLRDELRRYASTKYGVTNKARKTINARNEKRDEIIKMVDDLTTATDLAKFSKNLEDKIQEITNNKATRYAGICGFCGFWVTPRLIHTIRAVEKHVETYQQFSSAAPSSHARLPQ